jgi:hypothetical protein
VVLWYTSITSSAYQSFMDWRHLRTHGSTIKPVLPQSVTQPASRP